MNIIDFPNEILCLLLKPLLLSSPETLASVTCTCRKMAEIVEFMYEQNSIARGTQYFRDYTNSWLNAHVMECRLRNFSKCEGTIVTYMDSHSELIMCEHFKVRHINATGINFVYPYDDDENDVIYIRQAQKKYLCDHDMVIINFCYHKVYMASSFWLYDVRYLISKCLSTTTTLTINEDVRGVELVDRQKRFRVRFECTKLHGNALFVFIKLADDIKHFSLVSKLMSAIFDAFQLSWKLSLEKYQGFYICGNDWREQSSFHVFKTRMRTAADHVYRGANYVEATIAPHVRLTSSSDIL